MRPVISLGVLLLTLFLTACTSSSVQPTIDERLQAMGLERGEGNQSIPRYRINGWSSLDDRHLVITAGVNDRYLIELQFPCLNLNNSFSIGFTTPTGRLDRFEDIIVRHPGMGRDRCAIQDIIELHPVGE